MNDPRPQITSIEQLAAAIRKDVGYWRRMFGEEQQAESNVKRREAQEKLIGHSQLQEARSDLVTSITRTAVQSLPWTSSLTSGQGRFSTLRSGVSSPQTYNAAVLQGPGQELPQYKAWVYLPKNELASRVGHKMFYTDDTGETVPASESDDDTRKDSLLEGVYHERESFVIKQVMKTYGKGDDVLDVLSGLLGVPSATLREMSGHADGTGKKRVSLCSLKQPVTPFSEDLISTYFCRYCQTFCCSLHLQVPVRPQRQLAGNLAEAECPCSKDCHLHHKNVQMSVGGSSSSPSTSDQHNKEFARARQRNSIPGSQKDRSQDRDLDNAANTTVTAGSHLDLHSTPIGFSTGAQPSSQMQANGEPYSLPDFQAVGASAKRKRAPPSAGSGELGLASAGLQLEGWTEYEIALLEKGRRLFADDSCKIARLLSSKHCSDVHTVLCKHYLPYSEDEQLRAARSKPGSRRAPKNKVALKRAQHKQALWEAFVPCECKGECTGDCPCLQSSQFCEKYCACNKSCPHFFQGCVCTSGCRFKSCPCAAAGFECDPDVCQGCRCSALGGDPPEGKERCQNMKLRMRHHKRVAVGVSQIAGWGAFIMEPVRKNELIGEYTGEVVNQQEAERRGRVYDKEDNSYLFNLNLSWVIDARLRGNKLRFANHSKEPNCMAKILLVDGSHRVGIFAAKDMRAGTELTYDYLYNEDQAPMWAKK